MTRVLVVAKAPVPGLAKTRLAAAVGEAAAADLAAACLLDTLATARSFAGPGGVVVALTGDLDRAARTGDLRGALDGTTVVPQRGDDFAVRLVNAHLDAGDGALLQVGMDTPHLTRAQLVAAADALSRHDAVLGPALDGGWWVLGRHRADDVRPLARVPMSTSSTFVDTVAALCAGGLRVAETSPVRDLDEIDDLDDVVAAAPHSLLADAWRDLRRVRP